MPRVLGVSARFDIAGHPAIIVTPLIHYDRRSVIRGPYHRAMSRRADPDRIVFAKRPA
jgi:hypothetical protein